MTIRWKVMAGELNFIEGYEDEVLEELENKVDVRCVLNSIEWKNNIWPSYAGKTYDYMYIIHTETGKEYTYKQFDQEFGI